jgi:ABC-type multidrug transport system ATPase subunit
MSEEILKALMQLFALIIKRGSGVRKLEIRFVRQFLKSQLNEDDVSKYLTIFKDFAGLTSEEGISLTIPIPSVKDSVAILSICKKINHTLTQKQKVIVIIKLFELVASNQEMSDRRMPIINTVSEVFNITHKEFKAIETFVTKENLWEEEIESIVDIRPQSMNKGTVLISSGMIQTAKIFVLHITSVHLFFIKHNCTSGATINGISIFPGKVYQLAEGSTLRLSFGRPIYFSDVISRFRSIKKELEIQFEVRDISYKFRDGSTAINQISFYENQGKLIGILGASGAGKTTLLNILNGTLRPSSGRVMINGHNLHAKPNEFKGIIGNIPQDDLLIDELSIFQNLYFNARLCFKDKQKGEILKLVYKTLKTLGLYHKKDMKVGKASSKIISGGERKRLNLALELIREPSILFVDEPTSGLSSRDSENIMDILRELSLMGKLVFVVIHQPSSDLFKLFDNVIILDQGGQMAYYGNPVESILYFKKRDAQINSKIGECPTCGVVNSELIFNILDKKIIDEFGRYTSKRKVSPEKWAEYFRKKYTMPSFPMIPSKLPSSLNIPGRIKQFRIFITRDLLSKGGNHQYVLLNLLEAPALGFILSYLIYYIAQPSSNHYIFRENDNIPIYLFMSVIVALFLSLIISAEEIFKDSGILKRERFLHLNRSSYLFSKIIILFTISAFQTWLFILIGNSVLGIKEMNFYFWIALFSTAAFGNLLGLNVSASFNSAITIYIIIPLLIIPMMLLSGAMFSFDKLNRTLGSVDKVPAIAEFIPTRWTYEALMVHQFKENSFEKYFYDLEKTESQSDFEISQRIPALTAALEETYQLYKNKKLSSDNQGKLHLLRNEIERYNDIVQERKFTKTEMLSVTGFNEEIAFTLKTYLGRIENYFSKILLDSDNRIENRIQYMMKEDPVLYRKLKDDYYNEAVSDIVKSRFERNRIQEYKDRFIQHYHPVYQDPEPKGLFNFRTHFYAPEKYFAGKYMDTFWFNMAILWIMSIVLFITLYFELLKKSIQLIENLRFKN